MKESKQITVKEKYLELKSDYEYYNNKIRSTFIDSPSNLEHREARDIIAKKLKRFEEDFPEILV